MVPGTSLSWHLCVQSLSGEHKETPFCKPRSTFQTGLVSFLLVQRSGFYWIWWSEVNCGSFNTQGAQTFAGVTQCSPGFGVLVCGSARMGSRAYIHRGALCWADISKGVCCKENESSVSTRTMWICSRACLPFRFHLARPIRPDCLLDGAAGRAESCGC